MVWIAGGDRVVWSDGRRIEDGGIGFFGCDVGFMIVYQRLHW